MVETIEFRIPESDAARYLPADVGTRLGGTVRRLEVRRDEPLFSRIGQIDRQFRSRGDAFFTAWIPHRKYSPQELGQAQLLRVSARCFFEPAGEQCGTQYDDAKACPVCGGGAIQTTSLFLHSRRIPKRYDLAETIAGEVVVSRQTAELFEKESLTGASFSPVLLADKGGAPSPEHYQLSSLETVRLDLSTHVGNNPFDESRGGSCRRGDTVGLNLLSEVWIQRSSYRGQDLVASVELIGVRRGLLRPRPLLLVSGKAWRAMARAELKGVVVEVAHLGSEQSVNNLDPNTR